MMNYNQFITFLYISSIHTDSYYIYDLFTSIYDLFTRSETTMNEVNDITWHYVMDIHEPAEYWYSIGLMRKEI